MSPQIELGRFVTFIQENTQRIADLYKEMEEVQVRFNSEYSALLAEWQGLVENAAPRLLAAELPAPAAAALGASQAQERAKLEARLAELRAQLAEKKQASDAALQAAQAELARLRELNPALNQREEPLKAQSLRESERILALEEELKGAGFWNRLLGASELKSKLDKARKGHAKTVAALQAVREEWVQKKKEAEARQAELRAVWEKASVELSQLQAEHDFLASNLEALTAQRGAQAYLAGLEQAPALGGELGDAVSQIAALNARLAAYRSGLASVAESLGLLTGVRTGMERFFQSANKVYEEQRRYNLKPLRLEIPRDVVAFHNTWAEYAKLVRDEKRLGQNPLEFVRIAQGLIQERLTEPAIQAMFERMGQALNAATKAWK